MSVLVSVLPVAVPLGNAPRGAAALPSASLLLHASCTLRAPLAHLPGHFGSRALSCFTLELVLMGGVLGRRRGADVVLV